MEAFVGCVDNTARIIVTEVSEQERFHECAYCDFNNWFMSANRTKWITLLHFLSIHCRARIKENLLSGEVAKHLFPSTY